MSAPAALDLSCIPAGLRALPRWLLWRREDRDVKPTKVPYAMNGRRASSTDPATWTSFDVATAAYEVGGYDGVGFALNGDGLTAIDLDHCVTDAGSIEPWAADIVRRIDSYTEFSPSGSGLHIWARGRLPEGGRKRGPIEMYDTARYLTVTGRHLDGTPSTIEDRSEPLAAVHREVFGGEEAAPAPTNGNGGHPAAPVDLDDAEILRRAGDAKNGDRSAGSGPATGRGAAIPRQARPTLPCARISPSGLAATPAAWTASSGRAG